MKYRTMASFTVDTEKDLHSDDYAGIKRGLQRLLLILEKRGIKATFFVTGDVVKRFPDTIKKLKNDGHEVALHGYSHKRFDIMSSDEKKKDINLAIRCYKRVFKTNSKGFRAPQHSIDNETIKILSKKGIKYDSSICTGNLLLLRHLVKRHSDKRMILKSFFGKNKPNFISKELLEIPRSSPLIAVGGFEIKILPLFLIYSLIILHKVLNIPLNIVIHSWDLINVKNSLTSKYISHRDFEKKLERVLNFCEKRYRFYKMEEINENIRTN